jgi:NADH:ubiquinone oxidoreductase subunit 5 (subunit L)/multisubunit Na+/H+ antiporter MnhA subunit
MMDYHNLFMFLGICVVVCPLVLLAAIGLPSLVYRPLSEHSINRFTQAAVVIGLTAAVATLGLMLLLGKRHVPIELGEWVSIPQEHFHFTIKFVFDRLSVPFVILSYVLCGTIGAFAKVYMHREPGFGRFFVLYTVFLLGMIVSSLAGTIETLFAGWELVGLSSALLVGFFQERSAPVHNGVRVWSVYRVADAAFLLAAVALHHLTGQGDFEGLMGTGPWPEGQASLTSTQALSVGALLVFAAAGKSALVPFSGWLPRAMEGPTPSSAVFYGALSVHLGAFLLLRVSPILDLSIWLCAAVVALGLITALFAAITARVQTDIKSALAFASLTQVGIIVAEIGLGLRYVALVHIIGHACLRTLQLVRAPSLLRDYHAMENAIGSRLEQQPTSYESRIPEAWRIWLYRLALERGYLDALLTDYLVFPFVRLFQWCDAMERTWTDFLSGGESRESEQLAPSPENVEEPV